MTAPTELAEATTIQRLTLRPGDVIVYKCPWRLTDEEAAQVKEQIDMALPEAEMILILDGGTDIAVLRAEEAPA